MEYANYKVVINGMAAAFCRTEKEVEDKAKIFRSQGYEAYVIYAPNCRELF
jgi:hypothetical protein